MNWLMLLMKMSLQVRGNNGIVGKRYLLSLVIFIAILTLVFGCGLVTIQILNSPQSGEFGDDVTHTLTFAATEENNEVVFKGFELYYKFFGDFADISKDGDDNLESLGDLEKRDFYRASGPKDSVGNIDKPLIEIPRLYRGDDYVIKIDFSPLFSIEKADPLISSVDSGIVESFCIRRGIEDSSASGEYKHFYELSPGDKDLANINFDSTNNSENIYIAIYILSYGSDLENEYYSNPLYLGYRTLNLRELSTAGE